MADTFFTSAAGIVSRIRDAITVAAFFNGIPS